MANQPFDREIINLRERPLSSDVNLIAGYADQALRELILRMLSSRALGSSNWNSSKGVVRPAVGLMAFIGSAFAVRALPAGPPMQVTLDVGLGFLNDNTPVTGISSISGLNDLATIKPISLTADEPITGIPNGDPTNSRVDIIEVALGRRIIDPTSRDVLDPVAGAFSPNLVNKTLSYNMNGRSTINGAGAINYKTGTPAGSPVAPATDAGYVKIAEVFVPANATSISQNQIKDLRLLLFPGGVMRSRLSQVSASNSNVITTTAFAAPPGVLMTAYNSRNVSSTVHIDIAVVMGDVSGLNVSDVALTAAFYGTGGAPDGPTGPTITPVIVTAGSSDQTALAAGSPSLPIAVGQTFLKYTIGSCSTIASTVLFDTSVEVLT